MQCIQSIQKRANQEGADMKRFYYMEITKAETERVQFPKKHYITICIQKSGVGSGTNIEELKNEISAKTIAALEVLLGHKIDAEVN